MHTRGKVLKIFVDYNLNVLYNHTQTDKHRRLSGSASSEVKTKWGLPLMKDFFSKLLNGMSIGIVVSLIPNALLGEILKLIIPHAPYLQHVVDATVIIMSMLPVLIGVMVGITFQLTPIQIASVGIAAMVGSGAIEKTAASAFALNGIGIVIASYKANSLGTALAHVLGSPKIQMRNFFMKPKIAFPMLITAAVLGALAGVFHIQGTPYSAGFGLSGLVGPLNFIHLAEGGWTAKNIAIMLSTFFVLPFILNIGIIYVFSKKLKMIKSEDYQLNFE